MAGKGRLSVRAIHVGCAVVPKYSNTLHFNLNVFLDLDIGNDDLSEVMLAGRLAFVTGAGSGLGRATCRVLAREGAAVVSADVNEQTAHATLSDLSTSGANVQSHLALKTDVSSLSSVESAAEAIQAHFGRPADVVVNSAGITRDAYLLKMREEAFDQYENSYGRGYCSSFPESSRLI